MAVTTPAETTLAPRGRRLSGIRRAFGPVAEARGMARTMLWLGAGITLAFVLIALLAPVISPYDFDAFEANGKRFPAARGALSRPSHGDERPVDGRPVESHLGDADGAQGRPGLAPHLHRSRSAARALLRLLRGEARPRTRADHGRAARVSVPSARDRDRLSPLGQGRPGNPHRRDRHHGRLHTSLLPRGPESHDQHQGGAVRRGGEGARCEAAHDHPEVRLLQRRAERPAARDAQRRGRHPHTRRARLPRLRNPAHRGSGVGIRRQPRSLGRSFRDLVDRPVSRTCDRPAGRRAHPSGRGPQRDDQPGPAKAVDRACRSRGRPIDSRRPRNEQP